MYDFDQVRLLRHYSIDIFVGSWQFIDDAGILPTFDACRLHLERPANIPSVPWVHVV
jgi:hypothetical protein